MSRFRDQREGNRRRLNLDLDSTDFGWVYGITDSNQAASALQNFVVERFHHHCPLRRVTMSDSDPPYYTPVIKLLYKKKNKLYRKHRYKEAANVAEQIRNQIRNNCWRNRARGTKKWWQQVNYLRNKNKDMRNEINFSAAQLNEHYNSVSRTNSPDLLQRVPMDSCVFVPINENEVYRSLLQLKQTSAGPDELPTWLLRETLTTSPSL